MRQRQLGGSGLRVSAFTLGTMTWGDATDAYDAEDQLTTYLQMGGSTIDTAPIYGRGTAEALVGSLLAKLGVRDHIVLAGKAGIRCDESGPPNDVIDASRKALLGQLHQSLRDLGTDYLDLWQIHRWDPTVPIDEVLSALEYATRSGLVRYVGVSNYSAWQVTAARLGLAHNSGLSVVSNQVEYSMLVRDCEAELSEALRNYAMSVLAWSPLAGGVLTGKYRDGALPANSRGADPHWTRGMTGVCTGPAGVVEAVVKAAEGLDMSPAQVALAWIVDRPLVASAILGARSAEQLAENLEAEQLRLPPEITQALDDVSAQQVSARQEPST